MTVKKQILVVEDEPQLANLVKMRLEANSFEALLVSDGLEALKKVTEVNPDLILLDIQMPGLDGFGVLRALMDNEKTKSIPVIMFTTNVTSADVQRALEIGARDYISKPFETKKLLKKINKLI